MKNLYKLTKAMMLALLCIIVASCTENNEVITMETMLDDMVNRENIARFPKTTFKLKQESSYNRASKTKDDPEGWFKNEDFNSNEESHNFIRVEENNGEKEWVIMEHENPGVIVRTWMPYKTPDTPETDLVIRFYFDGAETPSLEGNMLALLNGDGLIPYPLAHKSLRSAVSFFPFTYAKSCKVTVAGGMPSFFQITYREYSEDTEIKTFTVEDFEASKSKIDSVCKTLLADNEQEYKESLKLSGSLAKGEEKILELPEGTAAVNYFSIKLNDYSDSTTTRSVIVKMTFDDKQTVWCPIGDFFASGMGLNPHKGWYQKVDENGEMSCNWVMPYKKGGSISIINAGDKDLDLEVKAHVTDWKWDDRTMYFHAGFRYQDIVPTRPFSDWNYIEISGRGVYVGDALTVYNPVDRWWGEGDEKIWVDGEDFPSIFGTGTEDYYGYSWGGISTDFYEHPFHAQPQSHVYNKLNRKTTDEKSTKGYNTETRSRSLDIMPFNSSLVLDMEVWAWTDCEMKYGVGMYWYGDLATTSNRQM